VTKPVIANQVYIACTLIDPTNNEAYRIGVGDVDPPVPHIPNIVRLGCTLIDPVTGLPYH
jgi:hypothetical protein